VTTFAAALFVGLAASLQLDEGTLELTSLEEAGPTTHALKTATATDDTGRAKDRPNFAGPRHGLPGYKESHDWETGADLFSPVVFKHQFYSANYGIKDEAAAKQSWKAALEKSTYPNCPQGIKSFSANQYVRANPSLHEATKGNCLKVVEEYLVNGIYNGAQTYSARDERRAQQDVKLQKQRVDKLLRGDQSAIMLLKDKKREWNLGNSVGKPLSMATAHDFGDQQYSMTMSIKLNRKAPPTADSNMLHYGNAQHQASPSINIAAGSRRVKVNVAMDNDASFSCSPTEQLDKKWSYVGVVVRKQSVDVFINGKKAKTCANSGGTVRRLRSQRLYSPGPRKWAPPAHADVREVSFYPGATLSPAVIKAEMTLQRMADEAEEVSKMRMQRASKTQM